MRKQGDSVESQLYEACKGKRVAAQILDYFMAIHNTKLRKHPKEDADSPLLWMDFTYAYLAGKFMVCADTVARNVKYLDKRGFITTHSTGGMDRTKRYQLHRSLVETIFQPLPLWEATKATPGDDAKSECNPTPCKVATRHGAIMESDTMQGCIYPSPSLPIPSSSSSRIDDDEIEILEEKTRTEAKPGLVPSSHTDPAGEDEERESLIDQLRGTGFSRKNAETYLTDNTRQKIRAALACLRQRLSSKQGIRGSKCGFIDHFLADPAMWGHERDQHGCWRPVAAMIQEEKHRQSAAHARDHPPPTSPSFVDDHNAAETAWEALGADAQSALEAEVKQTYPDWQPRGWRQECRRLALQRSKAPEKEL